MRKVIIDGNALGHTVKHSLGELTQEDLHIGVAYGFIFRMLYLARLFQTNQFVFAWDSRANYRKEIYPEYKQKYTELSEEEQNELLAVIHQFRILREQLLPSLGFVNNYMQDGMEGDDIIASIVFGDLDRENIVVSSDNDLYQLLDYCDMYLLSNKKIFTRNDFRNKYGIEPFLWARVKALAGCSGDKVPGLKGIGNLTAIKYIKGELTKGKKFDTIKNNMDKVEFTSRLVVLPFEGTLPIKLKPQPPLDLQKVVDVLEAYDMYTLVNGKNYQTWKEIFCA